MRVEDKRLYRGLKKDNSFKRKKLDKGIYRKNCHCEPAKCGRSRSISQGKAISAVGLAVSEEKKSWEGLAKYMPGTEIATSLTHEKIVGKLLAMTKVGVVAREKK